jgi:uncharacterized short protein YbdD (DUF466 family)
MIEKLKLVWKAVRRLSGDDAYEQYLKHFAQHHAEEDAAPLDRAAFFKQWQDEKWTGIKRCC